jgi:arsenate reductase
MISNWLETIENNHLNNPVNRHADFIENLAKWIYYQHSDESLAKLNFICTHNSRRSQFAQSMCHVVQVWMGVHYAESFSGGTEVTACNHRTIEALKRIGLNVSSNGGNNPVYTVTDSQLNLNISLWSKVYDDEKNPQKHFAAVMTCDHADENCPFIPGAEIRIPLTYVDPKYADDTDEEASAYDHTCKIIATDMIRLFRKVQSMGV